ncbi:uncharacterized protein EV154DRAFT_480253 [Mucor mucedo]|uniref:uncharacterized protein n=1 Tax=Mucor mucedo TaxID=29922 RepID=UPI002220C1FD|nr:uncharacterized protein EV154DRAFT_480253 [Mucor mucedo]KAI7892527.1 hypothetical protein EV154DRAFT_480253 [Mucor mucedo]
MQTVFSTNIRVNTRHYRADMASERSKGHRETASTDLLVNPSLSSHSWATLSTKRCDILFLTTFQRLCSFYNCQLKHKKRRFGYEITDNHKEPPLRTCSSPLSPLLRSDLPLDIKQEFLDRIRDATISVFHVVCMRFIILTYKIYHSQVQPSSISATRPISQRSETGEIKDIRCLFKSHKCILVFKKATFVIDRNNNTSLEIKKGPLASDILTKVYYVECSEIYLPPPLDHSLFSSTSSSRQLLQLFNFETENRINNRSRHGECTLVFLLIFFGIR